MAKNLSTNITNMLVGDKIMRTINFSIGLPEETVNELEKRIDGKTYRSRNAVIRKAVKEFLNREKEVDSAREAIEKSLKEK